MTHYRHRGATLPQSPLSIPRHYHVNHSKCHMGKGREVFDALYQAILDKQMVNLDWVQLDGLVEEARDMTMHAQVYGMRFRLPLTVVAVFNIQTPIQSIAGFSYGTRKGHLLRGEERFCAIWDHQTDDVWFEICSFSQPARLLSRVGWPLVKHLQRLFLKQSTQKMHAHLS
ncbi:MAG: DUF1990 domain-containing protein [Acidobacteria bacterium]|nr:DUF1990 domain-containing protein [Acidobacteriota bacterium]